MLENGSDRVDRVGAEAEGGGEREGGVFGGMEVLQCYNPHESEGFCTIGVLQRCYRGATGCYGVPQGAEG